jgi:transcription elongation factor GreA
MVSRATAREGAGMTYDTTSPRLVAAAGRAILTQTELDRLVKELKSLRSAHRESFADRLRHARGFGALGGGNDEHLAAFEDAVIDEGRIVQLERLIDSATVVDGAGAPDGTASLGSIVQVEENSGRRAVYEIVGVPTKAPAWPQVTPGSPMGQALLGARTGDTVRVMLPSGRERSMTVLSVKTAGANPPPREPAAAAVGAAAR